MTSKITLLVLVCLVTVIIADLAEGTKKNNCARCNRKSLRSFIKNKFDSWKNKWSKCTPKRSRHVKSVKATFDKCYKTVDDTCSKDSVDNTDWDKLWDVTEKFHNYIEKLSDNIKNWLEESTDDDKCRTNLKSTYDDGCAELQKYSSYTETSEIVETYTKSWKTLYTECGGIISE